MKKRIGVLVATEFKVRVKSVNNYYAFGMLEEGMSGNSGGYRYGYNGKEMDNEIKGVGNSLDYGARMYDARLGRWGSVDPLFIKYPMVNTYAFTLNNPVRYIDMEGKDVVIALGGLDAGNYASEPNIGKTTEAFIGELIKDVSFFQAKYHNTGFVWDFDAKAFASDILDLVKSDVIQYIKDNYTPGEKLIIYGYSWGAETAIEIASDLQADPEFKDVKIDLLITVDAAKGPYSSHADRDIPGNVIHNVNYFQVYPSSIGSHGGGNAPMNVQNTVVENIRVEPIDANNDGHLDDDEKAKGHSTINEQTFNEALDLFRNSDKDEEGVMKVDGEMLSNER